MSSSLEQRFWKKVVKASGCWSWKGQTHSHGYGRLEYGRTANGRTIVFAHRLSWELHNGPIPDGMHVLHRCDNPSCTNPDHLFLGDQVTNNNDKIAKQRQAKGTKFPHSKLTPEAVSEMRSKYASGGTSLSKLADEYGIAFGQVGAIIRREAWKHVY